MQPFVVMAKPVGSRCNLSCSYCYYSKNGATDTDVSAAPVGIAPDGSAASGETDVRASGSPAASNHTMSQETLERFVKQFIEACPRSVVSFTWHGGEPTLAGLDFFKTAVELQKRYLPEGKSCWNNLQTNGVLLDDAWCEFLASERFDVGLSIDGTQKLHDKFRKDRGGHGSFERAAAAVDLLKKHGVRPDLLCTVNSSTMLEPTAVYRSLRELNTGWIQFIPIVRRKADERLCDVLPSEGMSSESRLSEGLQLESLQSEGLLSDVLVTEDSVTAEGYGSFLCDIFDEWSRSDIGKSDVQLFAEMIRVWSGNAAGLCWMAPSCGRALIVEQDGGVYSCDHFVSPEHRIGDIYSSQLGDLAGLPEQLTFGNNKRDLLPLQCRKCMWHSVCNGGCPKDRFAVSDDGESGLNYLCAGLRKFYSHANPIAEIIMEESREQRSPKEIMSSVYSYQAAKWKNVGRNDHCPCGSGRKAKNCCWSKRP